MPAAVMSVSDVIEDLRGAARVAAPAPRLTGETLEAVKGRDGLEDGDGVDVDDIRGWAREERSVEVSAEDAEHAAALAEELRTASPDEIRRMLRDSTEAAAEVGAGDHAYASAVALLEAVKAMAGSAPALAAMGETLAATRAQTEESIRVAEDVLAAVAAERDGGGRR